MSTGKIVATVVGLTAAVLLINQLCNNSSQTNVTENFNVGGPALRPGVHRNSSNCGRDPREPHFGGRKLTSDLPDSVFFTPSGNLQPKTVMSTGTNFQGLAVGGGGPRLQLAANTRVPLSVNSAMSVQLALNESEGRSSMENFEQAADIAEYYATDAADAADTSSHGHRHRRGHELCPVSNPVGCGPRGTIAAGYGMANLVGSDFSAIMPGKESLLESSGTSYTSELPVTSLDSSNIGAEFATDRLVYSTLARARCPGTVDFIRGDLPIVACGQYMQTAARPSDSLFSGAMAAIGGIRNDTSMATSALISADSSNGGTVALSGMDLSQLVQQPTGPPPVTEATFAPSSAALVAERASVLQNMNVSGNRRSGSNTITGDAMSMATQGSTNLNAPRTYIGYTSSA